MGANDNKKTAKRGPTRAQKAKKLEELLSKATAMRRWLMIREEDISGVSGIGIVAEGVEFSNGWVAVTWDSRYTSVTVYSSISVAQTVHSHKGQHETKVVFIDNLDEEEKDELLAMLEKVQTHERTN